MAKRELYRTFIDRMTTANAGKMFFEASWYAYAILEDRLLSMLRQSGGTLDEKGKPIRMMGPKIDELRMRAKSDSLLRFNFPDCDKGKKATALWKWKEGRDVLMHGMATGDLTIEQIDELVAKVASEGARLARLHATAAMRLKNHRAEVTAERGDPKLRAKT